MTLGRTAAQPKVVPSVVDQAARAVWPGARVTVTKSIRPVDGDEQYFVLPTLNSPRWLLPTTGGVLVGDLAAPGSGLVKRAGLRALAWALSARLGGRLPLPRVRIEEATEVSLAAVLRDLLDERELAVALRLGHWQDPRSVVLRAFSPTGATLAFAKLGLDAAGRASVLAEATGLAMAGALRLPSIISPEILHRGPWPREVQDGETSNELLVTSPLVGVSSEAAVRSMPVGAMGELARARGVRVGDLMTSSWADTVRRRLLEVTTCAARDRLSTVVELMGGYARRQRVTLPMGCWHGDWTPWNMAWAGRRVMLWDWEHAADDVPVGFDHLHFTAQCLRVEKGTDGRAERRWITDASRVLEEAVGLDRWQLPLVLVGYLLEVNLRYVLDRQATSEADTTRAGWGMDLLESRASALRHIGG